MTILTDLIENNEVRVCIAFLMEVSEDASNKTVMRVLPGPTGSLASDLDVALEGSRTAAITVWFERNRYLESNPLPIPLVYGLH